MEALLMNKTEVMALLKENKNERGIKNWKKLGYENIKSFGIGLTQLRKLGKKIGRDQKLARQLWKSNVYDAKVLGLLIDEPRNMTREQAEEQVEDLDMGMLSHVFGSCDATLAKTPFARELAVDWAESEDDMRRRCGYLLLYELSKNTQDKALTDAFFGGYINRIRKTVQGEENWVRAAMSGALMGIGKRNLKLNKAAIKAAKAIGLIEVDYGSDNSCEPLDVMKHLTSDTTIRKLKA